MTDNNPERKCVPRHSDWLACPECGNTGESLHIFKTYYGIEVRCEDCEIETPIP